MIFKFGNYRSFLVSHIKSLPRRGFGEAKKMAEHLGVSSTFLSHVLAGSKQLSLEQAHALTKYLGLNNLESEYFLCLVQKDRAGTKDLQDYFSRKLTELSNKSLNMAERLDVDKKMSETEKATFYSSPIYSSAHIFCATHKLGRTVDEVAKRFEIDRARANAVLRFLVESGMCIETEGRFQPSTQSTHLEFGSPHLFKHISNWRLRAIQAAENLSEEELMYTVNVALSKKDYARLREDLAVFIKKFLEEVYPSPSEEIACLNLDWFWIRS